MRKLRLLYLALILLSQEIAGQTAAKITDVNFSLNNNLIVVEYNLINDTPKDRVTIALKFITETNQVIIPKSVTA